MGHHLDIDARLRAARPEAASIDASAYDAELLARVREQPIARRALPRAVAPAVAGGVTLAVVALLALTGDGPGGGPSRASAITQALHWLNPPAGTVLHTRSVENQGGQTTTHEVWQSADDPSLERVVVGGDHPYEESGAAIYDPATNTIYDPGNPKAGGPVAPTAPDARARRPRDEALPSGDPIVQKVRTLLQDGEMEVSGPANHDGTSAYEISLKPDLGIPVWGLWVAADDGKPLELRDPGRDASEQPQVIRWPTYEVLPGSAADQLSLTVAHPSARVVHDPEQVKAAEQRLTGVDAGTGTTYVETGTTERKPR